MKFNQNIFTMLCMILALTFIGCVDKSNQEVSAKHSRDSWLGTYEGRSPSYNMENQYGEPMVIYGNYVTIPAIDYTFKIYDNSASIYISSVEGDNYSCHNIYYSVSSNGDGFSLTMMPEAGSDCGGNVIVLTGYNEYYNIEEGASGQPSYSIYKK